MAKMAVLIGNFKNFQKVGLRKKIKDMFDELGIEIPYLTNNVYLRK